MDLTDWILVGISLSFLILSVAKSRQKTAKSLKIAANSFSSILPLFAAIFLLVGLFEVLVSEDIIRAIMGGSRGVLAPIVGLLVGGAASGPPAAGYPVAQFLIQKGASIAAVGTFVTAWVAVGTVSLPAEIRVMGKRFALSRWALTAVFSVLIGVVMGWLM